MWGNPARKISEMMDNEKLIKELREKFPIGSAIFVPKMPEKVNGRIPSPGWNCDMDAWLNIPMTVKCWELICVRVMECKYSFHHSWIARHSDCVCDSFEMFYHGCKCGAIQRERKKV